MKLISKRFVATAALLSSFFYAGLTSTAPLDQWLEAYKRGDYAEAFEIIQPLANTGEAPAQYNLAMMYATGRGISRDYPEALRWLKLAAAQGNPVAHHHLGLMYDEGKEVSINGIRAHMWFNLSAAQGYTNAAKQRDLIASRLTNQEMTEAQTLARECLARKYQDC